MAESELTTTSYILLGLLSSRDWSAYELAEQVGRGVDQLWASADRRRYDLLKKLDQRGLVETRKEGTSRRPRTMYSITPAGRDALQKWLASETLAPSMEFDGMVRVLVADEGTIDELRTNLASIREQAEQSREIFAQHARFILDHDGGTFPDRVHLNALVNKFMVGHFSHVSDWASWALDQTATWADTKLPADMEPSRAALEECAAYLPEPDAG